MKNTTDLKDESLEQFLKNQFPDCKIKCGHLSLNPMLIFSILMYYSCVMHVVQYFQQCCSTLDKNYQLVIQIFFRTLFEHQSNLNNEAIRGAIREVAPL
jgi:hypothetical protein